MARESAAILELIRRHMLVGIIRAETEQEGRLYAETALEAGFHLVEFTLNGAGALDLVKEFSERKKKDTAFGVGTTMDVSQAKRAIKAGAEFVVSPHTEPDIVAHCLEANVLVVPGVMTPSEAVRASNLGAPLIKVFPAEPLGGAEYIKALRGPLADIRFMPTGGIRPRSIPDYIRAGVFAVGVGLATDRELLRKGDREKLKAQMKEYVEAVAPFCGTRITSH